MIKITSIVPTRYALFTGLVVKLKCIGRMTIVGNYAIALEANEVQEDPVDEGWIYDEPSQLLGEGYNDCFQYKVDASLRRYVQWYTIKGSHRNEAYGGTNYYVQAAGSEVVHDVIAAVGEGSSFRSESIWITGYHEDAYPNKGWVEEQLGDLQISCFQRYDSSRGNEFWLRFTHSYRAIHTPDPGQQKLPTVEETRYVEVPLRESWTSGWFHFESIKLEKGTYIPTYPLGFPRGRPAEGLKPWDTPSYEALYRYADETCSFGDLSAKAAESVKAIDINSIAYLKDFAELGKLAKSLTAIANPSSAGVKGAAKAVSSTYLAAHYGAKLTVKDTLDIADAIDQIDTERFPYQRLGAQEHFTFEVPGNDLLYSCDMRLSGYIESFSHESYAVTDTMKKAKRALYESDLVPSLENIWDMVPFSFIMDWFVPIGQGAEHLETKGYIQTLPVVSLFYTRKLHWAESVEYSTPAGDRITGSATCELYYRQCRDTFIPPPLRVDKPKGLSGHWVEGAALLVQNL